MPRIFISYKHYDKRLNNRDETVARKLYDKLRAAGFECWMDKMNMPIVTESWINNIVTAIKQCDLVVMVVSEHSQNSDTIRKKELRVISQHKKPIIPFRIDQSELLPEFEWEISSNQWVEAWDDYESKIDEVISKLRLQLGDPHTPNLENISDKESTSVSDTNKKASISDNKSEALDYLKDNGTIEDLSHLVYVTKNDPNQHIRKSAKSDIETIKNQKVLFFYDDPFIANTFVHGLPLFGWGVTLVSEVDDLFRELKNNQYDVIIMDIMAPVPKPSNEHVKFTQKEIEEMDGGINTGVVLAKKILYTTQYKDIPILFLTAKSRNPILDNPDFANNNKCGYIRKPALASDVSKALQDLLNV